MKSSKPNNQKQPVGESNAGHPPADKDGMPADNGVSVGGRQVPPVQSGSQYGGYGQSEIVFGRNSGSSSDEGGQGKSQDQDVNPAGQSEPDGADDGRQDRLKADSTDNDQASQMGRSGT